MRYVDLEKGWCNPEETVHWLRGFKRGVLKGLCFLYLVLCLQITLLNYRSNGFNTSCSMIGLSLYTVFTGVVDESFIGGVYLIKP